MGFFDDTGMEKEKLLKKCTLKQLQRMAEEKKIKITPFFLQTTIGKQNYECTLRDSDKITVKYITQVMNDETPASSNAVSKAPKTGKSLSVKVVAKAIKDEFMVHKRYDTEAEYERDFINWARGKFGSANVVTQFAVGRTKIDAVICGVGVELKYPKNQRPLMTLRGQIEVYQKYFGENILVLLFSGDCDSFAVDDFIRDMKEKKVVVIDKK
jgi:hypothetical protein